jgi:hypothetical protein
VLALFIPIQALDTVSEHGQRNIELTKNPGLLEGFNLNRRTPFTTIITNSPEYTLSKKKLNGHCYFPCIDTRGNLFPAGNFASYRLMAVFGVIENVFYHSRGYGNAAGKQRKMQFHRLPGFTATDRQEQLQLFIGHRYSLWRYGPRTG